MFYVFDIRRQHLNQKKHDIMSKARYEFSGVTASGDNGPEMLLGSVHFK